MKLLLLILSGLAASALSASDYYVDFTATEPGTGTKEKPFARFSRAAAKAGPGDTIYLVPKNSPVFQNGNLLIFNMAGTEEKPITVDGQMITITGTRRALEPEWTGEGGGIWSKSMKTDDLRFFMIFDGKLERMGRLSKWNRTPFKNKKELTPFEWTLSNGVVSFRLPDGKTPADIGVEYPAASNGVSLAGNQTRNVVIKNIIARNFLNDGFNIHQKCINIHFENIAAFGCGDDGLSAHTASIVSVKNYVSWNNSTGVCHVGDKTVSRQENVLISGSVSRDILCLNPKNAFINLVVFGRAPGGLAKINCTFENTWIDQKEPSPAEDEIVRRLKSVFGDRLPEEAWRKP